MKVNERRIYNIITTTVLSIALIVCAGLMMACDFFSANLLIIAQLELMAQKITVPYLVSL